MKSFSINNIPEFSTKEKIVVIGVIGKSPLRYPNKGTPLISKVDTDQSDIECFWDERNSILYLHALTYLDTTKLIEWSSKFDKSESTESETDSSHWLVVAGELAAESCRVFALILQLCHIVILSSPTADFDHEYVQLFKAIDAFRLELNVQVTEALTDAEAGGSWEAYGRCCCPRLLFHFRKAPSPLRKNAAALKALEHNLEDQIYYILRKARIITNVCAKSLFAIPKNEEFVYIDAENVSTARDITTLVQGLINLCNGDAPSEPLERLTFKQFLGGHVEMAFGEGFDDNVGKYAMSSSYFELPSAASWRLAARTITPIFLDKSRDKDDCAGAALYDALATDVRFSEARCAKVLPIAQASYTEGLPSHYSSQHHAHKLCVALGVLEAMARGPASDSASERLVSACEAHFSTRRLCEANSLNQNPCIEPLHDNSKEHSSGVRYISACNCGRSKSSREDPYSVKKANYTFYVNAAKECGVCNTLATIDFPVFEPSTSTFKAASVKQEWCSQEENPEDLSTPEGAWSPQRLSLSDNSDTPTNNVHITTSEKQISRQPSTTEYLPGMLHTGSPPGLLPAFSSWSLTCLGSASLYSHSLGLPEHLQPGFLPHTNFLVPWDCAVRSDQVSWRPIQSRSRGAKSSSTHQYTVKIFFGFEYECPRGHRFMWPSCESPGSAPVPHGPVPLLSLCPCRGAKCPRARATRLHLVTPKAVDTITLTPKIQPVSGGPIFIPQPLSEGPIKLTSSAYWILRFPYVYCDERGILPRANSHHSNGNILAPMFGLTD